MSGHKRRRHSRKNKKQILTRSSRAELQFPVSRVDRFLREGRNAYRLSSATPVFLAGVLEYLTSYILELAGNVAQNSNRMRITPEHVEKAVDGNQHLSYLFDEENTNHIEMLRAKKS